MIEISLTREQAMLVINGLNLYSCALDIQCRADTKSDVDEIFDIINAKLHPEYGAPVLQPKGCLT